MRECIVYCTTVENRIDPPICINIPKRVVWVPIGVIMRRSIRFQIDHRPRLSTVFAFIFVVFLLGTLLAASVPAASTQPIRGADILSKEPHSRSLVGDAPPTLEYAVVAPGSYLNAVAPLVEWKSQRGIPTAAFALEDIYLEFDGADGAARIHAFLRALNGSTQLKWLLLVGDSEHIPVRWLYAGAQDQDMDEFYPSDYYYAGLSGDWDDDGDGIYGEPGEEDWLADIYVGRLPVDRASEADEVVAKLLNYARFPPAGDWVTRAMLSGGLMSAPNAQDYEPHTDNAYEAIENAKIYFPTHYSRTTYYDYPRNIGGQYTADIDGLDHDRVMTKFNNGLGLVNFATQGYTNGNGLGDYYYHQLYGGTQQTFQHLFYYDDADAATNGGKLPLVYISSCNSANFTETDDTNLERLITNPDGGAAALVGPTGLTYRGETPTGGSFGNWWLDVKFWETFFDGAYAPGATLYEAKRAFYQTHMVNPPTLISNLKTVMYSYNLLGDPEMMIWTDQPEDPRVDTPAFYIGDQTLTVTVTNASGVPVSNALVALDGAGVSTAVRTDATGEARFNITFTARDDVGVTVTGHNILPFEFVQTVGDEPADLAVTAEDITFDPPTPQIGEETAITAQVYNEGGAEAAAAVVQFFDGDAAAGELLGSATLSPLAAGADGTVTVNWNATAGAHNITVLVDAFDTVQESDERNNRAQRFMIVDAPDLTLDAQNVTHAGEKTTIGERANFTITVENIGTAAAAAFTVAVYENDPALNPAPVATAAVDAPLGACDTTTLTLNWEVNAGLFYFMVDAEERVTESDESNNLLTYFAELNHPPSVTTLTPIIIAEDSSALGVRDLASVSYDNDGDALTYSLVDLSDNRSGLTVRSNGVVDCVPAENWWGEAVATIGVEDGYARTVRELIVNVTPVNDAPVIDPPTAFEAWEDEPFDATINASDIEGDRLTFGTSSTLVTLEEETGRLTFTPTQDEVGTHEFVVTVSDGDATLSARVSIVVHDTNDPPVIELDNTSWTARAGEPFAISVNASDADGDSLQFADDSALFDIDPVTGTIEFVPAQADIGTHDATISVNDSVTEATVDVTLTVQPAEEEDGGGNNDGDDDNGSPGFSTAVAIGAFFIAMAAVAAIGAGAARGKKK